MMLRKKFQLLFLLLLIAAPLSAQMQWHSPFDDCGDEPFLCGRAWNKELGLNFHRLPERYKEKVTQNVWGLSQLSAGLSLRFTTDSKMIKVKYVLGQKGGYLNMAWLNHSGVDLYGADAKGGLHWVGNHMEWHLSGDTVEFTYRDISYPKGLEGGTEFRLYLPPYNEVKNIEVGVDNGAKFA